MQIGAFSPVHYARHRPALAAPPVDLVESTRRLTAETTVGRVQSLALGNLIQAPTLDPRGRLQVTGDRSWAALDPESLAVVATEKLPHKPEREPVLAGDQLVYQGGAGLVVLEDGRPAREVETTAQIPLVALPDGQVLYGDDRGRVLSLDPRTGESRVRCQIPGEKPEPLRLTPAQDGGLYVQTTDDRVLRFGPEGDLAWEKQFSFHLKWHPPLESADGGRLYLGGVSRAMVALDAASGEQAWRHDFLQEYELGCVGFSPVVEDAQGNVYTAASMVPPERRGTWGLEPSIHLCKFDREGQLLYSVDTGHDLSLGGSQNCHLALDAQGNLCATPGGRLLVLRPDGSKLGEVDPEKTAGEDHLINHMALAPEGDRAWLLCGHYSGWNPKPYTLLEVDLPGRASSGPSATGLRESETGIQIGGVMVRRRQPSASVSPQP